MGLTPQHTLRAFATLTLGKHFDNDLDLDQCRVTQPCVIERPACAAWRSCGRIDIMAFRKWAQKAEKLKPGTQCNSASSCHILPWPRLMVWRITGAVTGDLDVPDFAVALRREFGRYRP